MFDQQVTLQWGYLLIFKRYCLDVGFPIERLVKIFELWRGPLGELVAEAGGLAIDEMRIEESPAREDGGEILGVCAALVSQVRALRSGLPEVSLNFLYYFIFLLVAANQLFHKSIKLRCPQRNYQCRSKSCINH